MNLYSIRNWSSRYENNRTRELKKLDWIPVPNQQDGEGYTLTVTQKDGPQLIGAWLVILQVASRCGERGTLMRDTAKPHDSASIARLTRFPEPLIQRALDWFSSDEMQWIQVVETEVLAENHAQSRTTMRNGDALPALQCLEGKGMEGKEENGKEASKEAFLFCSWFETLIPEGMKPKSEKDRLKWAMAYEDILRIDGQTKDSVKKVCQWAREHDFWKKNFLSPIKLRKKNDDGVTYFQVFLNQMQFPAKNGTGHTLMEIDETRIL